MKACDTLGSFWVYFHFLDTLLVQWWWVFNCLFRARDIMIKHIRAGMRMCPVFFEHDFPSCLTVCMLLWLKRIAKFLKDRSPGCSPRERGKQRHHRFSVSLQQCPGQAGSASSMGRREQKRPIFTPPAPGWQTSLLAAKPLGAASNWISQPWKSSKKGKRVKTKIGETCQMAAKKAECSFSARGQPSLSTAESDMQ